MKTELRQLFREAIAAALPQYANAIVEVTRPKHAAHGDYACNIALLLAKSTGRAPRELAALIQANLPPSSLIEKTEIAGAGFINVFLSPAAKQQVVKTILAEEARFGSSNLGASKKILVEFVSSNPTGPLHIGHGRGASIGASLCNVLEAAGYAVTREYYVNDAGRQMDILALSTWLRYLELNGINVPFPANAYQGRYVQDMGRQIFLAHADRYVHQPWTVLKDLPPEEGEAYLDGLIANAKNLLGQDYAYIHDFALTEQLGDIRNDLMEFGVDFDSWFSEKSLFDSAMVERTMQRLQDSGYVYEQEGAYWLRSSAFGDEKDRVLQRSNGQYTYLVPDIAYHLNKFERGFDTLINIWGADHHGYIQRLQAALQALHCDVNKLSVAWVQFAVLYRNGVKASMSTRSGEFVTLRELRQEVGNDAARFFYVMRKCDQHLDFDLDLAMSRSNENPVYYIQYAHARICSVLALWEGEVEALADARLDSLQLGHELSLLQRLAEYPEIVQTAAQELSPHHIAYYLQSLAADLHSYYNAQQFLVDDEETRNAKLALVAATRQVLANGLDLLGVSAPEKM